VIKGSFILLMLTAVAAFATHWLHPRAPAWYLAQEKLADDEVSLATIGQRWQGRVLWIDARLREVYDKAHVPGALLLNEQELDMLLTEHIEKLQDNKLPVIIYCDGHACQASRKIRAYLMRNMGLTDVWVLHGGWPAWQSAASKR
jgi:3-mercaptopyruvate sulfurtransferase SseA